MKIISALTKTVKDLSAIHDQINPEYRNRIRTVCAELNRIKQEHIRDLKNQRRMIK